MQNGHRYVKSGAQMTGAGVGLSYGHAAVGKAAAIATHGAIAAGTASAAAASAGLVVATGGIGLIGVGILLLLAAEEA